MENTVTRSPMERFSTWINQESVFKVALVAPLQILMWLILIVPTLLVIYLSLVRWEPILGDWTRAPFNWFGNYAKVLTDPRFWETLSRTLVIVIVAVGLEFLLGFALALFFSRGDFPGKRLFTSIILYPMMLPWVVVGFTFYLLFLDKGPVNYILIQLLGPGGAQPWFKEPPLAIGTIILADVWQWTPFMFLILYSGLGALPKEPVEAAMTLGATRWHIFRWITVPMLKPVIIIALVIRALECFKIFDLVFVMTGGGPGTSTESLSLFIYRTGFIYGQLSLAAAMAVLLLITIAIVTRFAIRPLEYQGEA